jgi:hypothetical protein
MIFEEEEKFQKKYMKRMQAWMKMSVVDKILMQKYGGSRNLTKEKLEDCAFYSCFGAVSRKLLKFIPGL